MSASSTDRVLVVAIDDHRDTVCRDCQLLQQQFAQARGILDAGEFLLRYQQDTICMFVHFRAEIDRSGAAYRRQYGCSSLAAASSMCLKRCGSRSRAISTSSSSGPRNARPLLCLTMYALSAMAIELIGQIQCTDQAVLWLQVQIMSKRTKLQVEFHQGHALLVFLSHDMGQVGGQKRRAATTLGAYHRSQYRCRCQQLGQLACDITTNPLYAIAQFSIIQRIFQVIADAGLHRQAHALGVVGGPDDYRCRPRLAGAFPAGW